MAHYTTYRCTICKQPAERDCLTVKKVVFSPMGAGSKTTKSRTIDHICSECLPDDPHWNLPSHRAPGNLSEDLEETRKITERENK